MPDAVAGTPLAKKLGVKERHRVVLVAAPRGWEVPDLPDGARVRRARGAPEGADLVVAFFHQLPALRDALADLGGAVAPDGILWVAWPRRAGGHQSDITDNEVREAALPLGLVDVKVAALDDDWSGLKLVWRRAVRATLT